jgi:hypothetical protein
MLIFSLMELRSILSKAIRFHEADFSDFRWGFLFLLVKPLYVF